MNCQDSRELISVLYDGEAVPVEFADHVEACANCRESLRAYAEIGAELRLLASRASGVPAPTALALARPRSRWSRLLNVTGKISVPKFAVAAAASLFAVMTVGLIHVHAQQNNTLWFQFTLAEKGQKGLGMPVEHLTQSGYDDYAAACYAPGGCIGTHIQVTSVQSDHVEIALRSRFYHVTNSDAMHLKADLHSISGGTLTYHPGDSLEIPVEGGGTLILQGKILDHKPRFMDFGIPLEPSADQLVLTSPVLISGSKVLVNMKGANTWPSGLDGVAVLYAPGTGLLKVALQKLPGAVEGTASWGNLDFKVDGQKYSLLTASQICGGDQPRTVWVTLNAKYTPEDGQLSRGFVSGDSLSNPHFP